MASLPATLRCAIPTLSGIPLTAFVSIKPFDAAAPDDLPERLSPLTAIEACHSVAGDENYILKVRVASPAALEELLQQIRGVANVSTRTTVVSAPPTRTARLPSSNCLRNPSSRRDSSRSVSSGACSVAIAIPCTSRSTSCDVMSSRSTPASWARVSSRSAVVAHRDPALETARSPCRWRRSARRTGRAWWAR